MVKLRPDIDEPSALEMARWLDERADLNLQYQDRPIEEWDRHTRGYVAVRLAQAAKIIRTLVQERDNLLGKQ